MLSVHVDNVQDVAVVQCEGRIVHSDAAYTLRNAVTLQTDARAVVLDLSGVEALEGGGLGMLVFLRQWARERGIQLKLFSPSRFVRQRLERSGLSRIFDVVSIRDVLALFGSDKGRYAMASEPSPALSPMPLTFRAVLQRRKVVDLARRQTNQKQIY